MTVDVNIKSQEDERGTDPFSYSLEAVSVEEESWLQKTACDSK